MGSKLGPAALYKHLVIQSNRAEKQRQTSDGSQALQTKNLKPRCTCVWEGQERDRGDAEVKLSRIWQVPVPLCSHTVPLTFLLMCSRRCSWPCRKQRCWNSVSSRSGLTSPPCSMFTTFLKPSAQREHGWWDNRTWHCLQPPTLITLEDISNHSPHFLNYQCSLLDMPLGHIHQKPRARESPVHPTGCCLCHESLSATGTLICQELKCQLLGNPCHNLQATGIQGKVLQSHRPSTRATFGKKSHVHIWQSALSTSQKSSKGF